jgi:hypothetical protein
MTDEQLKTLIESLKNGTAVSTPSGKRTTNRAVLHEAIYNRNKEIMQLRENLKRRFNIDVWDKNQFKAHESGFNWTKLQEKLALREADSASTFAQFLRAGVQNIAANAYETVSTSFEDWVTTVNSGKAEELFAPNHGVSFPREIGPNMKYPQVGSAALDLKLKNRKFGSIYALEMELLEDDTTGSFQRQSAMLGEYLKVLTEILCYGKLAGDITNLQYIDYVIPKSETKPSDETNYPWAAASAPFIGGGYNRPASYVALTKAAAQAARITGMEQKNLQGIRMQVDYDRFLIGPYWEWDLAILLHSAYYPAGAETAGVTGGAFAENPMKGMADVSVTRFMPNHLGAWEGSKAWYLVDSKKPFFIHQVREAVTTIQESPNAGASFESDVIRFKARSRMNADYIDPRFAYRGNDGSV